MHDPRNSVLRLVHATPCELSSAQHLLLFFPFCQVWNKVHNYGPNPYPVMAHTEEAHNQILSHIQQHKDKYNRCGYEWHGQ